ncbi:MAG: TenA family protein [Flavobacteriaceae bacterium]|nr:TenA family protein [Flavobacteriaceae bacterium]
MHYQWFKQVIDKVAPIVEAIENQNFIKELCEGNLSKERFHFYIHQDSYYLNTYGKVLASISTQLSNQEHASDFMQFANETIAVEKILHQEFAEELNNYPAPEKSPTCNLYTGYLSEVFTYQSVEVSLAAVLPCFWIYKEVGDYLLNKVELENHPYKKWIATYGGEDFANAVRRATEITEYYAQNTTEKVREEMTQAFLKTAQMEWMFWNSAYKLEKWPV